MLSDAERDKRHLKKHLRDLTFTVQWFSARLDDEMKKPSNVERGKRIARLLNELDMACDSASRYALGLSFRQIANQRKKFQGRTE
jgi:hypothetical protein